MAPTVQQFPQQGPGFFIPPPVPPHLLDRSVSIYGVPPFQIPLAVRPSLAGIQFPPKFFTCLPLNKELQEKDTFEGAYFLPPPVTPWKKRACNSEPPVMINGVQAFKKTRNVVQISPLPTAFIPTQRELSELTSSDPPPDDTNFQRQQLVPRTFLTEPLWSQLTPSNFVMRASNTHLTLPCTSIFVLEPKLGKILFRPAHFVVTVTGPGECIVPIQMRTDCDPNGKELRYVYCFHPQQPGTYVAKVRIAANGVPHVCQSPLRIVVTKGLPPCPPHFMMCNQRGYDVPEPSSRWLIPNPPRSTNIVNPSCSELGVLC